MTEKNRFTPKKYTSKYYELFDRRKIILLCQLLKDTSSYACRKLKLQISEQIVL